MNIFEKASQEALRFTTSKGEITVEQLWQLPLQSARGLSLDNVAQAVNAKLKEVSTESFVSTSTNPLRSRYELALEIVKHIIAVRLEENAKKRTDAEKAEERARLRDLLLKKQDEKLAGLTEEQINERLAELDRTP